MYPLLEGHKKEQLSHFIECFVEYPSVSQILSSLEYLYNAQNFGGEQNCMLLTGDEGSGKTYIIENFVGRYERYFKDGVVIQPILTCRIPARPNVENMMAQMLSDLGAFGVDGRRGRLKEIGLTEQFIKMLKMCQTRMIIINEFQELIEFKSFQDRQRIANRLKMINEVANVPIVLVGMPWAGSIAEEPQWASRLTTRFELSYFKLSSSRKREEYIRFLKGLALEMGFSEPPDLAKQDIAIPLFSASLGQVRLLKRLLNSSLAIALDEGFNTLHKDHIAKAFNVVFPSENINPFEVPLEEVKVKEVSDSAKYNPNAVIPEEALINAKFASNLSVAQLIKK